MWDTHQSHFTLSCVLASLNVSRFCVYRYFWFVMEMKKVRRITLVPEIIISIALKQFDDNNCVFE